MANPATEGVPPGRGGADAGTGEADATRAPAPPAPAEAKKPLRRLSTRAYLAASLGRPLAAAAFVTLGLLGTFLQTERGSRSWAATTGLGSLYLRAVSTAPLLSMLFFQGSALAFVLLARRLNEHKAAPLPPPPPPRSRQERRRWEAEARKKLGKDRRGIEERVRAMGGRVVTVRD